MALTIISSGQATGGSYPHRIKIYIGVELISQNVAANTSTFRIKTWLVNETSGTPFNTYPGDNSYYLRVNGANIKSGTQFVDFRTGSTHTIADETITRTHNADGTLSVDIETRQAIDGVSTFDYAWRRGTYVAPKIIRASNISAQDGFVDDPINFTISKAAGVYTHDLELWIGSTLIATRTNTVSSTSMTLTSAEWAKFYNASKNHATIWPMLKLISKLQNGTVLDYRAAYPALTYKSNVIPTISSLAITDDNAKVVQVMGAGKFVRALSNIRARILGASGIKGSTISAYELIIDGTKFTSSYRVYTPVRSGTIAISGRVQDSRGRWSNKITESVYVRPYSPPKITGYNIERVNSNGTPNQLGIYTRHRATAQVSSVKDGATEKNQLRYYIQDVTGSPTTVLSPQTVVGLSRSLSHILGTYSNNQSYVFRLTAVDKFDQSYAAEITLPDARVPFTWGPHGGSFGAIFDKNNPAVLQVTGDTDIKGNLKMTGSLDMDGWPHNKLIGSYENLNNLKTAGTYYCPTNVAVATLQNSPVGDAFALIVAAHAGAAQILIPYKTAEHAIYHRNYYDYTDTWGDWARVDGGGETLASGGDHLNGWEDLPNNRRRCWRTISLTVSAAELSRTGPSGTFKSGWRSLGNWPAPFTSAPRQQLTINMPAGSWAWLGGVRPPDASGPGDFFLYKFGQTSSDITVFVEAVGPR